MSAAVSPAEVWPVLETVLDPEVPALSVVDLGIVRRVEVEGDRVVVTVTPTYSGCPATQVIERDIVNALHSAGWDAEVRTTFNPAWTSEWISAEGRRKLKAYGIAPPGRVVADEEPLVPLLRRGREPAADAVACPYCDSRETIRRSEFGSTACKAIHYCNACRQPFEEFKAI